MILVDFIAIEDYSEATMNYLSTMSNVIIRGYLIM